MKINNLCAALLILVISSGCALITDEYQVNQKKAIAFLLEDLPMPDDIDIIVHRDSAGIQNPSTKLKSFKL